MNEAMKLTEEPEPTAFLEKSRTMISKGMNLKIAIQNFEKKNLSKFSHANLRSSGSF